MVYDQLRGPAVLSPLKAVHTHQTGPDAVSPISFIFSLLHSPTLPLPRPVSAQHFAHSNHDKSFFSSDSFMNDWYKSYQLGAQRFYLDGEGEMIDVTRISASGPLPRGSIGLPDTRPVDTEVKKRGTREDKARRETG
jgi:hypothetical protein